MAVLNCPGCGAPSIDVHNYDACMVLRRDVALFSVHCPQCGIKVSSMQPIPKDMLEDIRFAAIELGAKMGCDS